MPVLGAAVGVAIMFGFLQAEDLQAVEEFLDLAPGVEGHAGVTGPAVPDAEQLAGEDPAGGEGLTDPRPQGRESLRRAERQAEACVNQGGVREVRLSERRA